MNLCKSVPSSIFDSQPFFSQPHFLNTVPYTFLSFQSPRLTNPDFLNMVAKESESLAAGAFIISQVASSEALCRKLCVCNSLIAGCNLSDLAITVNILKCCLIQLCKMFKLYK